MNNEITILRATRELSYVKGANIICQPVRDSARWADLILSELRQQLGLDWDAPISELYEATVNLRERIAKPEGERASPELIEHARAKHQTSDDVEIDDNARVSRSENGNWVQGWFFVYDTEGEEE